MDSEEKRRTELNRRKNQSRIVGTPLPSPTNQTIRPSTSGAAGRTAAISALAPKDRLTYIKNQNRNQAVPQNPATKVAKKVIKGALRTTIITILVFILPWILIASSILLVVVLLGSAVGIW